MSATYAYYVITYISIELREAQFMFVRQKEMNFANKCLLNAECEATYKFAQSNEWKDLPSGKHSM